MARYRINTANRLGVSMPELRALGKAIGKDHQLALADGGLGRHIGKRNLNLNRAALNTAVRKKLRKR
jgi:hypothetical protein